MMTADVDGPMHYVDHGGPADAPVMVLVHGLGASNLSWLPLAELLVEDHRVIAVDLVGFGHSAPEGRRSGVRDNRDHLARFLRQVVDRPVTLVGNSMGGMVSALTAHAHPSLVDTLVLLNPALPGALHPRVLRRVDPLIAVHFALYNLPFLGGQLLSRRRRRFTPRQQVDLLLNQICADASRVDQRVVELLVSLAATRRDYDWSDQAFLDAERSIMQAMTVGRRRYIEILSTLRTPTLLIHGEEDRIVDVSAARAIAPRNPRMDLVTLPDVGHAPQLEVPQELAGLVRRWYAGARPVSG